MDNISICVTFIAAIFGIAYPILLEVVSRLDEKYRSQYIIELFNEERQRSFFSYSLVGTLVCLFLYMIKLPPDMLFSQRQWVSLMSGSAVMLVVIATCLLTGSFFFYVSKIMVYYTPGRFIKYLENKDKVHPGESKYFAALADVLYMSISTQNEHLAKTLAGIISEKFRQYRSNGRANEESDFPVEYLQVMTNTIELMTSVKNRRLLFLAERSAGSGWILNSGGDGRISENTFRWIWGNMLLCLEHGRVDFVLFHWQNAYGYIRGPLNFINPEYAPEGPQIINQDRINERNGQRDKFFSFHYALGGLLLYKKCYQGIGRFFLYTLSKPPEYPLLPSTMDEVFKVFFEFWDVYNMRYPFIDITFPFPEVEGINSDIIIRDSIAEYTALLLIRQYSIVSFYVNYKPMNFPGIPSTQAEKRVWIENLVVFADLVEKVWENKELMEVVHLSFVTEEWCRDNGRLTPPEFVDEVKRRVEAAYEGELVNQAISENKRRAFVETTNEVVRPFLTKYDVINNKKEKSGELKSLFVPGIFNIMDKTAFADDQEAAHLNFDSFMAGAFKEKFGNAISEIFVRSTKQRFILNHDDILPALGKLGINKEFIVILFGISVGEMMIPKESTLSTIQVVSFEYSSPLVGEAIFIIRKTDLPWFTYKELKQEDIEAYDAEKIIADYNIYTSLVDLNKKADLRASLEKQNGQDLSKSVYLSVLVRLEVQFRNEAKIVEIQRKNRFKEMGITHKLGDIHPF